MSLQLWRRVWKGDDRYSDKLLLMLTIQTRKRWISLNFRSQLHTTHLEACFESYNFQVLPCIVVRTEIFFYKSHELIDLFSACHLFLCLHPSGFVLAYGTKKKSVINFNATDYLSNAEASANWFSWEQLTISAWKGRERNGFACNGLRLARRPRFEQLLGGCGVLALGSAACRLASLRFSQFVFVLMNLSPRIFLAVLLLLVPPEPSYIFRMFVIVL